MATKIELTDHDIKLIGQYRRGEFNQYTCKPETRQQFSAIIDKAEQLCASLDAYDEVGDDLVLWFYDKYKQQSK